MPLCGVEAAFHGFKAFVIERHLQKGCTERLAESELTSFPL